MTSSCGLLLLLLLLLLLAQCQMLPHTTCIFGKGLWPESRYVQKRPLFGLGHPQISRQLFLIDPFGLEDMS